MTVEKSCKTARPKKKRDQITVFAEPEKIDQETARILSKPETRAASIIQKFEGDGLEINSLVAEIQIQTTAMQAGDMSRAEAMLLAQAHTLDALFANLSRRSYGNLTAGHFDAGERYLKLALKAQAQAVRTVAALGELKNPRHVAFVAQANISNGHQQVNNGQHSYAGKNKTAQNKLSAGGKNELLQDTRASRQESRIDPAMEAMGKFDRCQNP